MKHERLFNSVAKKLRQTENFTEVQVEQVLTALYEEFGLRPDMVDSAIMAFMVVVATGDKGTIASTNGLRPSIELPPEPPSGGLPNELVAVSLARRVLELLGEAMQMGQAKYTESHKAMVELLRVDPIAQMLAHFSAVNKQPSTDDWPEELK